MLVTKVEQVTKTKYRVELDQQFAFVLYKGELVKFGIREMEEIPEEQYEKIRTEVIMKRVKLRAMHLLTDMARTERGLREKLKQGMYPDDLIDAAIDYVKSFGYLDDDRYAEQFVESRKGTKSKKEIRALLFQKGICAEKIDQALEKCWQEEDSTEAFRKLVAKALSFVLIVATAVSIYFTLYAKESILLLAGKDFLPAVGPMVILMPTVLLIGLSNITGIQILTPRGEEIKVVYSVTAGAVLDFVFNLILIPKFGADGAAFSTLMAEVLVLAIQGFGLRKELKGIVKEIQVWKIILGLAGATAAGYFAGALTNLGIFFTLCVSALFFFGTYGIILLMLRETFVTSTLESCLRLVKKRG